MTTLILTCRKLTFSLILSSFSLFGLAACGGGGGGGGESNRPLPDANPSSSTIVSDQSESSRFLARASFGGTVEEIDELSGRDAADWLDREFDKEPTFYLDRTRQRRNSDGNIPFRTPTDLFWQAMIGANDQLRQRMVFALSQILVVSQNNMFGEETALAAYMDILSRNAFGNYRDLLEDITYSPIMANFLTYLRNQRGDPNSDRQPDENYAREILQLMTIGLVELNLDGTPVLLNGEPIETYNNDDIVGLARVFTGLAYANGANNFFVTPNNTNPNRWGRLIIYPEQHSELEKSFLGASIPAGTSGEDSIDMALDIIFNHPNVAPFVSRQLIQRFTASSPSPEYVERVAIAFESGQFEASNGLIFGTGERGDLRATLAAILLDRAFYNDTAVNNDNFVKTREPVLRFVHWSRVFGIDPSTTAEESNLSNTASPTALGQHPFRSPSVFNFYRPGYVAPGTETSADNLTAPELQIINSTTLVGYINFMTEYVFDRTFSNQVESFAPNYNRQIGIADDAELLVDDLNLLLTGNRLSTATRAEIVATINTMQIREDRDTADRRRRVQVATLMILASPAYTAIN